MTDEIEGNKGRIETKVQIFPEHPSSMDIEDYLDWRRTQPRSVRRRLPNRTEIEEMVRYQSPKGDIDRSKADLQILAIKTNDRHHPNVYCLSEGKIVSSTSLSPINEYSD